MPIEEAVKTRKVLLVYITRVSGHRQASVAIQRSLKTIDPGIEIKSINGFGYTFPRLEKIVNKAYMGVIKRTPKVWDYLYDNPKFVRRSSVIKDFLHKTSHNKLSKLFDEFKPDTVVCTQAFPCGMIADFKMTHNLNIKLIAVLTDYAPHAYWVNEGVDYYVVPSEKTKERFLEHGISPERIKVLGIPVRPRFSKPLDKEKIAVKSGLNLKSPTILVMGGGQGLGPIKDVVKSLIRLERDIQLIVIAGTNARLMKWLKRVALKTNKKMITFQYADNIEELMGVSTLIVTKPGGITTSEALAKGLPMVIVNPLPGQEMFNTNFLLEKGIAVRVDDLKGIGRSIEALLQSPQRLESMMKAALDNAKPQASVDIARLILQ